MSPKHELLPESGPGICLVGTGAIARDHMATFEELGLSRRLWVVSRRDEAARDFAKCWGFDNATTEFGDALKDPAVEVVLIASPSSTHVEQATRALVAGKDVIVEIPVGLSFASVELLAGQARETGRRVFACHTMRSFAGLRIVRKRILAGDFTVTQVNGVFAIPRRRNQGWNGERSWVDNLLWHHACHQVDATLWLLGTSEVGDVTGMVGRRHPDVGMYMDLTVAFSCGGDIPVTQALTYNCDSLLWDLRLTGLQEVFTFRNGRLVDDAGSDVVEPVSIRDLLVQNTEIFDALANGSASPFDLSCVLPSYNALQRIDDYLAWSDD